MSNPFETRLGFVPERLHRREIDVRSADLDPAEIDPGEDLQDVERGLDLGAQHGSGRIDPGAQQPGQSFRGNGRLGRRQVHRKAGVDVTEDRCDRLRPAKLRQGLTRSVPSAVFCPIEPTRQVQVPITLGKRIDRHRGGLGVGDRVSLRLLGLEGLLAPGDIGQRSILRAAHGGRSRRRSRAGHVQEERAVSAHRSEHRGQRVDPLLTIQQLPRPCIRVSHMANAGVVDPDRPGLLPHPAQQDRADRIPGQQRVQQVPHADLVPRLRSLDEGQVPGVRVPAHPTPHEVTDGDQAVRGAPVTRSVGRRHRGLERSGRRGHRPILTGSQMVAERAAEGTERQDAEEQAAAEGGRASGRRRERWNDSRGWVSPETAQPALDAGTARVGTTPRTRDGG